MRAEEVQIPVKTEESPKNSLHNAVKADNIWAELRRAKARIASLESQVSTLRRDYNRLNSKYYREDGQPKPSIKSDLASLQESIRGKAQSDDNEWLERVLS